MISGVAIMTDTDNTGETAIAYYGDIVFKKWIPNHLYLLLLNFFLNSTTEHFVKVYTI